jgi:hypothetical protein
VVGADGTFYRYTFDKQAGGEGRQESHQLFLKGEAQDD